MQENILTKRKDLTEGFHAIPNKIMKISKYQGKPFGFSEKCTYCYLLSWSYSKDKIFPSMSKMCQDLGVASRTSMKKYLDKLEGMGLILVEREKGKSSSYQVVDFDTGEILNPSTESLNKGCNASRKATPEPKPVEIEDQQIDSNPFEGFDFENGEIPF